MTVAFVQANTNGLGPVTSAVLAYTSNTTPGNFLALVVGTYQSAAVTPSGIADTQGNTWTKAVTVQAAASRTTEIWYVNSCVGGANTVTVTNPSTAYTAIALMEYSGVDATSPFDVSAGAATSAVTSHSSGNTAASTAGDLVLGGYSEPAQVVVTQGSGFTMAASGTTSISLAAEYILSGSAGAQAATFTSASATSAAVVCATFKQAVAAGASAPPEGRRGNRPRMFRFIIKRRTFYLLLAQPFADAGTRFRVGAAANPQAPVYGPMDQAVNRTSVI